MYENIGLVVCCDASDVKRMTRKSALLARRLKCPLKRFRFAVKVYRATCKKLTIELDEYIEDGLLNDAIDYRLQSSNLEVNLEKFFDLVS